MIGPKTSAKDKSLAVGGNVNAPVVNASADHGSFLIVNVEQETARELPSHLGSVIAQFAQQSLAEYGRGARRELPAEVKDKVIYNDLPETHRALADYCRHSLVLERAYQGAEQQNADARYLVRRWAGTAYESQLSAACKQDSIPAPQRLAYVKANAASLVDSVVERLLGDYKSSKCTKVEQETAHLAISLIVADAVIECEVLERPPDAPTT
jgi:hypothetical protein